MAIDAEKYNVFVRLKGEDIANKKGVGCILGEENLRHGGERPMGVPCKNISENGYEDNGKRRKKKVFDKGSISYMYDPNATDGRKVIKDAYDNDEDTKITITLQLPDGTLWERDVLVTSVEPIVEDGELGDKAILEFLGMPRETPAA